MLNLLNLSWCSWSLNEGEPTRGSRCHRYCYYISHISFHFQHPAFWHIWLAFKPKSYYH